MALIVSYFIDMQWTHSMHPLCNYYSPRENRDITGRQMSPMRNETSNERTVLLRAPRQKKAAQSFWGFRTRWDLGTNPYQENTDTEKRNPPQISTWQCSCSL